MSWTGGGAARWERDRRRRFANDWRGAVENLVVKISNFFLPECLLVRRGRAAVGLCS